MAESISAGGEVNGYGRPPSGRAAEMADAWRSSVLMEREQVEALPDRPRPEDFYRPVAESFRAGANRPADAVLEALLALAKGDEAWIDLGAGGGRFSIPLAEHVKQVIAIEPSGGMREVLNEVVAGKGIANVEVLDERWPGCSQAPIVDVGFIANVGHDIEEIGEFIAQLERHAAKLCIALLNEQSPTAFFAPLWVPVHGEDRVLLPGARQLAMLLMARGIFPEIRSFSLPLRTFADKATLRAQARRPLWVQEGSPADGRLEQAIDETVVEVEGCVSLAGGRRRTALLTWGA